MLGPMKSKTLHLQSWTRVALTIAIIAAGIFLARLWTFSSPLKGTPVQVLGATPESFDLKAHFHNRPPYYAETPEGVVGLCATPVARALEAAGISFDWIETPPKRQLHLLRENPAQDCIVGWYKTDEREKYARYSTAIYQDKPAIALVRSGDRRIAVRCTLAELLSIPDIIMLSRAGYSYGSMVDRKLMEINPRRIASTADSSELLSILYSRRADFIIIAPEEADYLLDRTELPRDDFRHLALTDMPPGNNRYVMFSRAVPAEIVDRFNTAYRLNAPSDRVNAPGGSL
jgi:polar amino acid transport system substrate-binding protein